MANPSEDSLKTNCPHCDPTSFAFKYPLFETNLFRIVCDVHPLEEGHILIIPKKHISCIGDYTEELYNEFLGQYKTFSDFLRKEYGSVGTFEHGKIGQTVFHSHVHLLPFHGNPLDIIPEGEEKLEKLNSISDLKKLYKENGGYLFFSINNDLWSVNIDIAAPRFFRDRFAKVLGKTERGNWKEMRQNKELMELAKNDDAMTQEKWKEYNASK